MKSTIEKNSNVGNLLAHFIENWTPSSQYKYICQFICFIKHDYYVIIPRVKIPTKSIKTKLFVDETTNLIIIASNTILYRTKKEVVCVCS